MVIVDWYDCVVSSSRSGLVGKDGDDHTINAFFIVSICNPQTAYIALDSCRYINYCIPE